MRQSWNQPSIWDIWHSKQASVLIYCIRPGCTISVVGISKTGGSSMWRQWTWHLKYQRTTIPAPSLWRLSNTRVRCEIVEQAVHKWIMVERSQSRHLHVVDVDPLLFQWWTDVVETSANIETTLDWSPHIFQTSLISPLINIWLSVT